MSDFASKYRKLGERAKSLMFDESFQNYFYEAADEIDRLTAEVSKLKDALRPFSKAHQSADPYTCITLHDLRMAFNAMQEAGDDSTPVSGRQEQNDG